MIKHNEFTSGKTALAVVETQTLHDGHVWLLSAMLGGCDTIIVAPGSCDKHGIYGHPWTFEQRREMIRGVFGDRFHFVPLHDIDASVDHGAWMNYVLKRIREEGLPEPTDYFTGSAVDARWYEGHFPAPHGKGEHSGIVTTYRGQGEKAGRSLHIVDRDAMATPSGREVRFLIERRDPAWRQHVPERLWNYIEWNYPPHLRQAIKAPGLPADNLYPVGTRLILTDQAEAQRKGVPQDTLLVLRHDGVWRPHRDELDEKAAVALRMHREADARLGATRSE